MSTKHGIWYFIIVLAKKVTCTRYMQRLAIDREVFCHNYFIESTKKERVVYRQEAGFELWKEIKGL